MSHESHPIDDPDSCDALREWADANCSDDPGDTGHGLVRAAVLEVERELFDRTRGGGARVENADLVGILTKALNDFAELAKKNSAYDVACAGRSAHAIFLKRLANRRGIPEKSKTKMLDDWKEVWSATTVQVDPAFAVAVDFDVLRKDCDPSEIGSDALCGGCAVS